TSVRLGVGLAHLRGNATAVRDGVAVLPGPLADLGGVTGPAGPAGAAAAAGGGPASTGAPGVPHPGRKGVTQPRRVLRREVDLVIHAVEAELDRLVRGRAVDVIDQGN